MSRPLKADESHVHKIIGSKVGLEEVEGIEDASIITKNIKYSIERPMVYKIKGTESLLILGSQGRPMDLDKLRKMYEDSIRGAKDQGNEITGLYSEITSDQEGEDKNELPQASHETTDERISEEDIKLISSQIKASREEIISALVESNYDVVDAMMKLTK
ncbi:nascent polypeptide-associated complex domain-containing protein [Encephalitozoon hellem ATCC 50504]|uniref:Nascent polypeptide-associated complex subunit beta n=1 Tax=Encephalitozoon hellem TaxID=27973 RepID=A0A9Q9C206_ENCHE|nr:nascent polypeptide-associated complex domain-containing protein [Encephalitozoon hellem ATCC 50504]AFM97852.1 nascent polypeptide-associated complex domain-containing protein [Encephalitozoon hellem ATCC 50504]UTX42631.1 nascent polypeptide-associated complex subunit alpha [Encephalitozoon hellem]|eukprot:XP_003886833.1 nascent polypeptide-associated complex domain-containing protein [Encephalitozoon hellem ATCC 50504]